jgi:riboflavin kinase/FMN adenylyltransferase
VLTFDPHPLEVLRPELAPKLINSLAIKRDVLEGLGVEELVVIGFDEEFSRRSAEDFIDYALVEKLGARRVAVGENFHFGAKARGTPAMLAAHPEFETRIQKMVEVDGETVSSSRIRAEIAEGDMESARRCLGVPYMLEGEVVTGDRRGRELGFPTANIVPDERLVTPGNGVYAAFANGHPAAVSVGTRPTFDSDRGVLVETYLIDFSGDLYGQTLRVAFVERMRPELAFDDVDKLVAQMHVDVEEARRICADFTEAAARGG